MDNAYYLWLLVVVAISALAATIKGKRWEEEWPEKRPFSWGYFVIYSTTISSISLCILGIVASYDRWDGRDWLVISGFAIIVTLFLHREAMHRKKYALIVYYILGLNVVWYVANFIYLKNRWSEFSQERGCGSEYFNRIYDKINSIDKYWRFIVYVSVWYISSMLSYLIFSDELGYSIDSDEIVDIIAISFGPPIAVAVFYLGFRKYVSDPLR